MQPVQLRDYSKVNFKVINDYVKAIRADKDCSWAKTEEKSITYLKQTTGN